MRAARLSVRRWPGSEPRIHALHGFAGNGGDFSLLHDRLPYAMDAVDLLGHGSSPSSEEPADYAAERQVALLDGCLPGNCLLLGYSMGGRLALQYAAARPGRVRALILVGASPGLSDEQERTSRQAWDEAQARRLESEGLPAFLAHWWNLPIIRSQASIEPAHLARMRGDRQAAAAGSLCASLRGFGTGSMPPLWTSLSGIRCPVLLVAGETDEKYRRINRELAGRLQAESAVIGGAGHCAHLERPEACAEHIRSFVEGLC